MSAAPEPPPPVIALPLLTLAWVAIAVPNVTDAGSGFVPFCLLAPLSALVAVAWFWALVVISHTPRPRARRWFNTWAGCTAAVAFTLVLAHPAVGFRARVWLSTAALERFARSLPPDAHASEPPGMVGLFYVTDYSTGPDGSVALFTSNSGMLGRAGILYLPPGATASGSVGLHGPLFGSWHWFYQRF
jgi:hypothetical protein